MTAPRPRRTRLALVACVAATAVVAACQVSRPADQPSPRSHRAPAGLLEQVDFVQFRWEDSSSHRQVRYVEPWSKASVALNDSVVLDIRGIDSAWASPIRHDTAHWDVALLLSRAGAAQFGATTATHAGRRLAIVVDGTIVLMPVIKSSLGPRAMLASEVPRSVADSLAARVNHAVAALRPWQPAMFPRDVAQKGAP